MKVESKRNLSIGLAARNTHERFAAKHKRKSIFTAKHKRKSIFTAKHKSKSVFVAKNKR